MDEQGKKMLREVIKKLEREILVNNDRNSYWELTGIHQVLAIVDGDMWNEVEAIFHKYWTKYKKG